MKGINYLRSLCVFAYIQDIYEDAVQLNEALACVCEIET